ncbi:DHA2 family efflux MFS transporter permease subunit [Pasteurellaceae bacterium LIM206]|nr:DHA2 family efflux MFS transporter permease subunit [Pasteurellaceae bacterium LIM206]
MSETPSLPDNEKIDPKLLLAIIAMAIMSFSGVVSETAMNVTFPTLMREFNIGTSTVQWLTTGYLLVLSLVVPLSSFFKKRFKSKLLFLTSISLFITATLLCAFAPNFYFLLLGRLMQGAATGIALPLMINIILEQAPKSKLGLLMGSASLITAMAPAVGPVLGGFIVDQYGWRVIFLILLPLLICSFLMGVKSIRQHSAVKKMKFNLMDYLLLVIGFSSFIFATEQAAHYGWFSAVVLGLLLISLFSIGLFYQKSAKGKATLLRVAVFKHKAFSLSFAFIVLIQFCVLALGYLIPNYAQLVSGSSAFLSGFLLLPGCIVGAALAPVSGRLLDQFGPKKPILTGSFFLIVSLILFYLFADRLSTAMIMIFYTIYSIGQGLSVGNTMTNGLRILPKELSADGNAIINTLQQLAGAVGTSVVAAIISGSQQAHSDDFTHATMLGTQQSFMLLVVLAVIAGICALAMFKVANK